VPPQEPMFLLRRACFRGIGSSCLTLGATFDRGKVPSPEALELYSRACASRLAKGCLAAGKEAAKGGRQSRKTALLQFDAGCKLEDGECCHEAAEKTDKDEREQRDLYRQLACRHGYTKDCNTGHGEGSAAARVLHARRDDG